MQEQTTSDRGKVRIAVVDVEGDGQTLRELVREYIACVAGRAERAPAVEPMAALALPAPAMAAPVAKRIVKPRAAKAATEGGGTLTDAIRAAVRERPRTSPEVLDAVKRAGFDSDSRTVSTILCQRRKANEMYKDEDLKWRFAIGRG